ncbi:hypothetical protein [Flavobacterium psychrophilum]|uniref:hypothetical protein n=1 Tax=Flavobacterium psychrophilum TaxID=96345 RepID=UPI000B7C4E46|nr:hypothetical protein [Flavobacterium psychrophilum]MCB6097206.1 hypothetical protein [Flavobacterium psychrophilum]SNA87655.1 hypothetical protein DK095_70038 [Flavobacterium psychrophilum]SNB10922.1 hypothetical protein JIP1600_1930018 [Flavobacterium psychrophilum]
MEFNKEKALDELMQILNIGTKPTFSEIMKAMLAAQNYLVKIHIDAYQKGLEKGIKKIEIDDSN